MIFSHQSPLGRLLAFFSYANTDTHGSSTQVIPDRANYHLIAPSALLRLASVLRNVPNGRKPEVVARRVVRAVLVVCVADLVP